MGVTYQTAHKWFKEGRIDGAYQLSTGTIIVPKENEKSKRTKTIIYTHVSSNKQCQTNLVTQAKRLVNFCMVKGWVINNVVVNKTLDNDKNDLISDFTAIITSFSARLYSKRRQKQEQLEKLLIDIK